MLIKIMNRTQAKDYAYKKDIPITAVISISDIDSPSIIFCKNNNIKGICKIHFNDVEKGTSGCITKESAKYLADFINTYKDKVEQFVVHCNMGISRSAGIGAAIMKYLNGDDTPVFENPRYVPNMTCYSMLLREFMPIDDTEVFIKELMNIDTYNKVVDAKGIGKCTNA